jgi:hypothetical protein
MNEDTKAYIARVTARVREMQRRMEAGESTTGVYGKDNPDGDRMPNYYQFDLHVLAGQYLREHPVDEDVPLDEEFLVGLGWEAVGNPRQRTFRGRDENGGKFLVSLNGEPVLMLCEGSHYRLCATNPTRGDLRRLFAALGNDVPMFPNPIPT